MEEVMMQQELAIPESFRQSITPEMSRRIALFQSMINIHDKNRVFAYGIEEQAAVGSCFNYVINGGSSTQAEASEILDTIIAKINQYQEDCDKENKGLLAFLKKPKSKLQTLQTKYQAMADELDGVVKGLRSKEMELRELSRYFDMLFAKNNSMYESLTIMIYAGELVLQYNRQKYEEMKAKANISDPMKQQRLKDDKDEVDAFERRLYELKLSRTIAMQQAPQIRLVQKGADTIAESIRSTIATAIPLWKSQMAIALGMEAVSEGVQALNSVRNATNEMLLRNAEKGKQLAVETAKVAENGAVDVQAITKVNQSLIEALNASSEIASKAITSRVDGAHTLQQNESELKDAIERYVEG